MKNTVVVAGVAAAFLVLAPGAALATTPTGAPATPSTSTIRTAPPSPTGMPSASVPPSPTGRITRPMTLSPAGGVPGARIGLDWSCRTREPAEKVSVQSEALAFDPRRNWDVGTVKDVKPGKYAVTLSCGPERSTAWLAVLPAAKQVAKVPSGAPQTGGTDGPVDDSGFPAAAAMGALAVGGTGLVLARRARRR
ncbi:hypothetical protein [Amycolatopsis kentuckyensis]|uniref:hypothetical protein n=1 Tax=Amycolatopsis kentuckyensis TaxID=218823 RepID=UPI000A3D03E9|nr:hypothetical protein [Amycolatopsis kentuckyensis]